MMEVSLQIRPQGSSTKNIRTRGESAMFSLQVFEQLRLILSFFTKSLNGMQSATLNFQTSAETLEIKINRLGFPTVAGGAF